MNENSFQSLRNRTDAKLRYARVHIDELSASESLNGDDFDRAHQESFLYHLLGAKDAFLLELNAYYECGLSDKDLTAGKLRDALKTKGMSSNELTELYSLEKDNNSWLSQAKAMRDYSTHVTGVRRTFNLGGQTNGQIWLVDPNTGQSIERHFVDVFDEWAGKMQELLERSRQSAIARMRTGS
jgi:hypothetical protein